MPEPWSAIEAYGSAMGLAMTLHGAPWRTIETAMARHERKVIVNPPRMYVPERTAFLCVELSGRD